MGKDDPETPGSHQILIEAVTAWAKPHTNYTVTTKSYLAQQLSGISETSARTLARMLDGESVPDLTLLDEISRAMKRPPAELIDPLLVRNRQISGLWLMSNGRVHDATAYVEPLSPNQPIKSDDLVARWHEGTWFFCEYAKALIGSEVRYLVTEMRKVSGSPRPVGDYRVSLLAPQSSWRDQTFEVLSGKGYQLRAYDSIEALIAETRHNSVHAVVIEGSTLASSEMALSWARRICVKADEHIPVLFADPLHASLGDEAERLGRRNHWGVPRNPESIANVLQQLRSFERDAAPIALHG